MEIPSVPLQSGCLERKGGRSELTPLGDTADIKITNNNVELEWESGKQKPLNKEFQKIGKQWYNVGKFLLKTFF